MTHQGGLEAELARVRKRLEDLDGELIRLVGERRALVLEVGRIKEGLDRPVLDPSREARVVRRAAQRAREMGVDEELVRDIIWRIIASAREAQTGRSHWGPPQPPRPETDATE
jgi:chorismate mutase